MLAGMPDHAVPADSEAGDIVTVLLSRREDQWFDRKSGRTQPRSLAEVMVAFANAEGGMIVVGLHSGKVEGLGEADENALRQAARVYTDPPVRHSFQLVPCELSDGGLGHMAVINIEASEAVHRTTAGDVLLRVGDESRRLRGAEIRELEYDKGQSAFDGRAVAGATMDDLDDARIRTYHARIGPVTSPDGALEARGLVTRRGSQVVPTTAGILLLGKTPQQFFPEAWVRVLHYRGRARETGSRANVLADERFEGTLTDQIAGVRLDLLQRIPSVLRLAESGRFGPMATIPQDAWLEAVVNAVVHRSYSMAGDHTRIELFYDRLEVESPGRLPGLVRIETIRSTRFARNPRIARALADLGYGRELGEGVDRMFEEMERAGLPDPIYEQRPASVRVSLIADPELSQQLRALPPRLERLFRHIENAGRLTTVEAMQLEGQSRPTTLKHLARLEAAGLIEHVGVPKDPYGFWRLPVTY
jgi:ATP-dependent DNA helicase RecG